MLSGEHLRRSTLKGGLCDGQNHMELKGAIGGYLRTIPRITCFMKKCACLLVLTRG